MRSPNEECRSQCTLFTRCDRCRDLVVELWPVPVRRRVELRCAMCVDELADVPREAYHARLRERLAVLAVTEPHLSRW